MRFLQLLSMQFLGSQIHLLAAEILDPEADATQFDSVELLDLVVKFAVGVLERADNEPETVNALLVKIVLAVIDIETVYRN